MTGVRQGDVLGGSNHIKVASASLTDTWAATYWTLGLPLAGNNFSRGRSAKIIKMHIIDFNVEILELLSFRSQPGNGFCWAFSHITNTKSCTRARYATVIATMRIDEFFILIRIGQLMCTDELKLEDRAIFEVLRLRKHDCQFQICANFNKVPLLG